MCCKLPELTGLWQWVDVRLSWCGFSFMFDNEHTSAIPLFTLRV